MTQEQFAISSLREDRIVNYLKEYIALCKQHFMYVTGVIGADTALWDEDLATNKKGFNEKLYYKISEIIYGGLGFGGLFSDDGNHTPPKKQLDKIWKRIGGK